MIKQSYQISTRAIFIFASLLIVSAVCLQWYVGKLKAAKVTEKNNVSFVEANNKLESFKSDGIKHEVFQAKEASKKAMKNGSAISPAYVDSLAKALKISTDNLKESVRINFTLQGKIKSMLVETDSLKRRTFYFQQQYLTAKFAESDSTLSYKYAGDLGYARIEKKSGFLGLGKIKKQVDVFSRDTNMTINGINQLSIKEDVRRKPFGIGIIGGYIVNPYTGHVEKGIGLGISYSLLRF